MTKYVVVDWRPYELPEIYGVFNSFVQADVFARKTFEVDTDDENLPDGIMVGVLNEAY